MRILLLNQCFYPDVVSTAQHLTDLATELSSRGNKVTVLTSDRGYDNSDLRFSAREKFKDINIIRISSFSLSKKSRWRRSFTFGSFIVNCGLHLLLMPRFDAVVALTSPPLISFLATLFVKLKGGQFYFWVMDLNPDEAITAGWLRENSLTARVLKRMLVHSLKAATQTIALDRFMEKRIQEKGIEPERIKVLPPWSHDESVNFSSTGREIFRQRHQLSSKFVIMYSGNHSPCHPLETLLKAAYELRHHDEFQFSFIGGGSEYATVKKFAAAHELPNILCLPYQPLNTLSDSLSAADLHVVVMGENFAGIIHPCKIYNILRIGAPVLYVGPPDSHVADLAQSNSQCFLVSEHGDVDGLVRNIIAAKSLARQKENPIAAVFSKQYLLPRLVEIIETSGFPATA